MLDIPVVTLMMFFIHTLMTPGQESISLLENAVSLLFIDKEDCTTGIAYCRQAIQLTFAANKIVGKLTTCHADEVAHEEDNLSGEKRRRHGGSDEIPTKLRRSLLGSPSGVEG